MVCYRRVALEKHPVNGLSPGMGIGRVALEKTSMPRVDHEIKLNLLERPPVECDHVL